jgi:hypothetical protein
MTAIWREDIDSLAFRPAGQDAWCMVHRRAFHALAGGDATPSACLAVFHAHSAAFERAARAKQARTTPAAGANFHIDSRDLRRALDVAPGTESAGVVLDTPKPPR